MKKKNISIDDLAVMVQKGFAETATKHDLKSMRFEMNERFDRIEKLILTDHKRTFAM